MQFLFDLLVSLQRSIHSLCRLVPSPRQSNISLTFLLPSKGPTEQVPQKRQGRFWVGPTHKLTSLNYITFLCLTSYYPSTLSILLGILQLHCSTETFIYLLVPVVGEGYFSTVLFAWELVVMEKGNNRESWKTQLLLGATLLTQLHCREDCSLLIRVWVLILNTCMRMLPIGCLIFVYIHCNTSSTEANTEDTIEIQSGIRDNEREP